MNWKKLLDSVDKPLKLPVAHDALTAKLIQHSSFLAYQIGGFATVGANFALPDIDLVHYGELSLIVKNIIQSSNLPVLVDCDNGYGDAKMAARTMRGYEYLGASALFIEDQASPKRCGHMGGKHVVPISNMVDKLKAGLDALEDKNTFVIARTDAYNVEGLESTIHRGERYLAAGVHGLYFEGVTDKNHLKLIAATFGETPLAVSILENGGKTPWMTAGELYQIGYSMILYPSTLIFRITRSIKLGLAALAMDQQLLRDGVNMEEFENIVEMYKWEQWD